MSAAPGSRGLHYSRRLGLRVYANGRVVDNVAHSLGVGLRLDVAWFSFIERTMVRIDMAKTINADSPVQFWLGMQHAF